MLLAEADSRDGLLFRVPEDAEVLLHPSPVPRAVGGVVEALVFHGVDGLGGVGKEIVGRRIGIAEAVVEWETEAADARENFDPGEKEPAECSERADDDAAGGEVESEEGGDEESEGAELTEAEMAAGAEGSGEDNQADDT